MNTSANILRLIEGSYPFEIIETNSEITEEIVLSKLKGQYSYRATSEDLWAELDANGVRSRYILSNGTLVKL